MEKRYGLRSVLEGSTYCFLRNVFGGCSKDDGGIVCAFPAQAGLQAFRIFLQFSSIVVSSSSLSNYGVLAAVSYPLFLVKRGSVILEGTDSRLRAIYGEVFFLPYILVVTWWRRSCGLFSLVSRWLYFTVVFTIVMYRTK